MMNNDVNGAWAAHQLTRFLRSISDAPDRSTVMSVAVEQACDAFEGDIAAITHGEGVLESIGIGPVAATTSGLPAAAAHSGRTVVFPGLGEYDLAAAPFEDDPTMRLVVARRVDDPFSAEDRALLRNMVRIVDLVTENVQLLNELRERQDLLQRLSVIQRSISHRADLDVIFSGITAGLVELLDVEIALIRVIDVEGSGDHVLAASLGLPEKIVHRLRRLGPNQGLAQPVGVLGQVLVVDEYPHSPYAVPALAAYGVQTVMGAPIHEGGTTVGGLVVASRDPARKFSESEREALVAFAEHASLALTDAKVLEGLARALSDSLTKLPSRTVFTERLSAAQVERAPDHAVAVLFIDMDRFKSVNDTLGHAAGDQLLIEVAARISACVRPEDTVARLGGDEFTVLLPNVRSETEVEAVATRIMDAVAKPIVVGEHSLVVSASIGIALDDDFGGSTPDLLNAADLAMYQAKRSGRGRAERFHPALGHQARRRLELETELRHALERDELHLHFQPLVDLQSDGAIVAAEALLRWDRPDGQAVVIPELIGVAEESGLIHAIGAWALDAACRQAAAWREAGGDQTPCIHVNISGHQLRDPSIAATASATLARWNLPVEAIVLEITESVLIGNDEPSLDALDRLRGLGIRLSLDDFGQGYSSLAYLAQLDIQSLKIDRSFIQRLTDVRGADVIVRHVIELAHQLGMSVVAEGTETIEQVERLRRLGCDLAQGYYFARPIPPDAFADLLRRRRPPKPLTAVSSVV